MAPNHRLKLKKKEVKRILKEGKKIRIDDLLLIIYHPNNLNRKRLAVIASRKVGSSVKRNRAKRLLRELFLRNEDLFPESTDVIFIASPKVPGVSYQQLEERVQKKIASGLYHGVA